MVLAKVLTIIALLTSCSLSAFAETVPLIQFTRVLNPAERIPTLSISESTSIIRENSRTLEVKLEGEYSEKTSNLVEISYGAIPIVEGHFYFWAPVKSSHTVLHFFRVNNLGKTIEEAVAIDFPKFAYYSELYSDHPVDFLAFTGKASVFYESSSLYSTGGALAYTPRFNRILRWMRLSPRVELEMTKDYKGALLPFLNLALDLQFPITSKFFPYIGIGDLLVFQTGGKPGGNLDYTVGVGMELGKSNSIFLSSFDRLILGYERVNIVVPTSIFYFGIGINFYR